MRYSPADSTGTDTLYCSPSWKVRQIYNIALAAQDLVENQAITLEAAEHTIAAADSVLTIQRLRLINVLDQANTCEDRIAVQEGLTQVEKRKKRRRGWIIVGLVTAWVGVEVLSGGG